MGSGASTARTKEQDSKSTDPVDLLPTHALQVPTKLNHLFLGLGWSAKGGKTIDLDASVACFTGADCCGIVSFQRLRDHPPPNSTIVHTGDILAGSDGTADLERVYFNLPVQRPEITAMFLVVNVFTAGLSFADLETAYCRLVNADSNQVGRIRFFEKII